MEIKTPSGYTIILKDIKDLTFRDKREIQKSILSSMKINPNDTTKTEMSGTGILNAQDAILKLVLKRIVKNDGLEVSTNLFDFIMDEMPEKDGDYIYNEINKYLKENNEDKGKNLKSAN
jgi:hypothetical protein